MPNISPAAIQAYTDALKRSQGVEPGTPAESGGADGGGSFADLVKNAVDQTAEAAQKSEETSMRALAGEGDALDVVTAVNSAEVTLQTVVTVRDKIISAYQEIMRMPI